jgi:hypothetical protein
LFEIAACDFCAAAEMVLARNKAVEGCLEAHGLAVKDLHPPPVDISTEWAYGRSPTRSDAHVRLNSGARTWRSPTPSDAHYPPELWRAHMALSHSL